MTLPRGFTSKGVPSHPDIPPRHRPISFSEEPRSLETVHEAVAEGRSPGRGAEDAQSSGGPYRSASLCLPAQSERRTLRLPPRRESIGSLSDIRRTSVCGLEVTDPLDWFAGSRMRRPSLTEVAQVAEIVAAVAVVISLIYVGRELRSNTAAVRAASVQAVSSESGESLRMLAADPALSRIARIARDDPSSLTADEAYRYAVWSRQRWLAFQNVYFQNELGVLDSRVWKSYHTIICSAVSFAAVRDELDNHRGALNPEFVALVESCPTG